MTESGAPPTRDEISQAFGFRSLNAAEQHLQALQKKGLIELVAGTSRGIRLKDSVRELMLAAQDSGLPVIGKVAAGSPILAQENVMATAAIDPATFKPYADYLLEVRGMSMRDAGILDGDWLAVHKQPQARSGQVVVARLGDEVTVKRLKLRGARAELIAENPDYQADHRRSEARGVCDRRNCSRGDSGIALTQRAAGGFAAVLGIRPAHRAAEFRPTHCAPWNC